MDSHKVSTSSIPSASGAAAGVAASAKNAPASTDEAATTKKIPIAVRKNSVSSGANEVDLTSSGDKDKEITNLKIQNKDLNEKLETLKIKRGEDREKLREYEKNKIQIQQVTIFFCAPKN